MVLCDAVVDPIETGGFIVTVYGRKAHQGQMRHYEYPKAKTEDEAAKAGLAQFIEEMEAAACATG